MTWLVANARLPVQTGLNRSNNFAIPDEIGVDEGGNGIGPGGDIQNRSSIYFSTVQPGTLSLFQADNAGRNMYGVVVTLGAGARRLGSDGVGRRVRRRPVISPPVPRRLGFFDPGETEGPGSRGGSGRVEVFGW